MSDYIKREDACRAILALEDRDIPDDKYPDAEFAFNEGLVRAVTKVNDIPAADVVERNKDEPAANADRIRAMTDKELAVWLAGAMLYGEPLKAMRSADWEKWLK